MTLEQSLIERTTENTVETHDCPGGWLAIVAKHSSESWVQYSKANDPAEHIAILRARAERWLNSFIHPYCARSAAAMARFD